MRIVTPTGDNNIVFIPRVYNATYDLKIRDRQTNVSLTVTAESITQEKNDYIKVTLAEETYDFNESGFYDLIVEDDSDKLMHREVLFCTSQTIDQDVNSTYLLNEGEYIANETENDYIVV